MIAICRDGTEDGVILMYWNQGRILVKIVGEVETIFGGVQKFSRVVQNDLRGGAHLPTPPLKIGPWLKEFTFGYWARTKNSNVVEKIL